MSTRLPVIAGFGGYNAAGRSSFHQAYRRMIIDSLTDADRQETLAGLATMMGLVKGTDSGYQLLSGEAITVAEIDSRFGEHILGGTLIRKIGQQYFDVDATQWQTQMSMESVDGPISFITKQRQLPDTIPANWLITELEGGMVRVEASSVNALVENTRDFPIKAAGQLPDGFKPADLYKSRFHPRGLQMTIVGISDAIRSLGLSWQQVADAVGPDEIAVFASSVFSQMDEDGFGGMMQSRLKGSRVSAKQLPLGLNTMPADFINAYVLGSVGVTGATTGACASFLYNLRQGIEGIQSGKFRVAIVGCSEAPITPEIVEGFAAMSALANEEGLKKLDGADVVDYRRTSRPFGENCGFTIGEAVQFTILMDDQLALELGADIYGAVTDVFINADGFKKSISAPGPGNFLTMAKAVASAQSMLGEDAVRDRSFVHAHGSSTPGNRTTESTIFNRVAETFGIREWPVAAVKAYVGHSIGPASGDQFMSALGSFAYGIIPGIKTIDAVADDVNCEHLLISNQDIVRPTNSLDVAFINSKGFGGNNATGVIIAPHVVTSMMSKRYGKSKMAAWEQLRRQTQSQAQSYNQAALKGNFDVIYNFGEDLIDESEICLSSSSVTLPGFAHSVDLTLPNRYEDMV